MPWHWDLHVWISAPNPNGTLAEWNPTMSCDIPGALMQQKLLATGG